MANNFIGSFDAQCFAQARLVESHDHLVTDNGHRRRHEACLAQIVKGPRIGRDVPFLILHPVSAKELLRQSAEVSAWLRKQDRFQFDTSIFPQIGRERLPSGSPKLLESESARTNREGRRRSDVACKRSDAGPQAPPLVASLEELEYGVRDALPSRQHYLPGNSESYRA